MNYVESSPEDQLQPKSWQMLYAKPGDVLDLEQPVLFDRATATATPIANDLFPDPYDLTPLVWRRDGRGFTFECNQRGHQVYRVIEVGATIGTARAVISEEPNTFFYYNQAASNPQAGRRFRLDVNDGRQVWMSERDGWNHLYLMDGTTGAMKNLITKGPWVVHGIERSTPTGTRSGSATAAYIRGRIRTSSITTASISTAQG